jgi:dienelactone hydrolase
MDEDFDDGIVEGNLPAWHAKILACLDFPLGWKGAEPTAWRDKGRSALRSLLLEEVCIVEPEPRLIASEERGGYRVDLISLALGRFRRSRAYLAIPEGPGPFPAALLLHDHGACFTIGKEKMIRPLAGYPSRARAAEWMETNYGGRSIGDDLAGRGWVVLAVDALGWGDRALTGYDAQQALASNLLGLGSSWAGLIAAEDASAAAFLASRPFVDGSRLAAVGHSMGGFRAWQAAALSEHVRAAVAVACMGPLKVLMAPGGNRLRGQSAFSMTHPGMARLMDFPDAAGLAAPKALLMIHGSEDRLYPPDGVREAYARLVSIYAAFGAEENFQGIIRPGGHVFTAEDQALGWDWLESRLAKGEG